VNFHRSTYRAISPDPKAFSRSHPPPEEAHLQTAALQSPPGRHEFSPEAHARSLDEQVQATATTLADGDYPAQHVVNNNNPRSGSRASSMAATQTTLITPKMQRSMQRAYAARHTAEAVVEKSNQWKLRNLVGPA